MIYSPLSVHGLMKKLRSIYLKSILLSFCFLTFGPDITDAILKPEEILVVVNMESPDSVRTGELYIELRKIPDTHISRVRVKLKDDISRNKYNKLIAEPVKRKIEQLIEHGENIRCIVTTYGIPLRVGPERPADYSEEEIGKYRNKKEKNIEELKNLYTNNKKTKSGQSKKSKKEKEELKKKRDELKLENRMIDFKLKSLTGRDTAAAVDSELALLLSPLYSLTAWQPNPQALFYNGDKKLEKGVLMVSRLDAPTPELTLGLIRTAIEVEKTGLTGKIYLDARGLTGKDGYSKFDEEIRRTAQVLTPGIMPVVLDNKPALFGPGEAPSAALYCGWYSIGKYMDAFEWSKGAVGYHVASSEAVSIHYPKSGHWVKNMLERGVIASIGPVSEPYLLAFPYPSLFFQLLMSGKYTLAEVYALTNPVLSWRMILIGDPLYNPFKNNPAIKISNLPPSP